MNHFDPNKKHDAILLVDCTDGNPNGDPDAGNQPRTDSETRHGLMTDACIKRKIRNYVQMLGNHEIFVKEGSILNNKIDQGYTDLGIEPSVKKGNKKEGSPEEQEKVQTLLRQRYFDIRMFGAVLSTGWKAGQVWGPVQVSWGRSFDPVLPISATITRCAATEGTEGKDNKTMGRKELIPYGLFKVEIHYNPGLNKGDVSEDDLKLFWDALVNCWEFDKSSARSSMNCQGLYIFTHDSKWGNYPSHKLFEMLSVEKNVDIPRSISDYDISIDHDNTPDSVSFWSVDK
jgi:CRISPR-associated protein Csd2